MNTRIFIFLIVIACVPLTSCTKNIHYSSLSQKELADIVIMSTDRKSKKRKMAFTELYDNGQLYRVVINSKDAYGVTQSRSIYAAKAVTKISNDNYIKRIISEPNIKDLDIVCNAMKKLNDQSYLTNIALNSPDSVRRSCAVKNIKDESTIEEIALNDTSDTNRLEAAKRLRKEESIENVILSALTDDPKSWLSSVLIINTIDSLSNKSFLSKILLSDAGSSAHIKTFTRMSKLEQIDDGIISMMVTRQYDNGFKEFLILNSNDPKLMRYIAGNYNSVTRDINKSVARIKLALLHPVIESKIIRNSFVVDIDKLNVRYGGRDSVNGKRVKLVVYIKQDQSKNTVSMQWSTTFPKSHKFSLGSSDYVYIPPKIEGEIFFGRLLRELNLDQNALRELFNTEIPELRIAVTEILRQNNI